MRNILLLLLLIPQTIVSQIISGKVVNEEKEPIPFTNIVLLNKKIGTSTDIDGSFLLDIKGEINDSIKISSIGYIQRTIGLTAIIDSCDLGEIILNKRELELNGVTVVATKVIFSGKKYRLGLEKVDNISYYTLYGDEICTYIQNERKQSGKLNSINLHLNRKRKANYTADLNVKIYKFNRYKNEPGEILSSKNIIISPGNKKQVFTVTVQNENIIVPKEGICIGIEWLGNEKTSQKYTLGPGIKYTNASNKQLTWKNFRDRGWTNGTFRLDGVVSNALVTIDVLYKE